MFRKLKNSFDLKIALYSFVNAYSYNKLRRFSALRCLNNIYVDGIFAVFIFRMLGFRVRRLSFDMTSLAPIVFNWCIDNDKTISFIGSSNFEINKAVSKFKECYPMLKIPYFHHGYLDDYELRSNVIGSLSRVVKPDVVVVGMGTPLQEQFLVDLKKAGWSGVGFTCGGFLHQTASSGIKYYPTFFDKYNLRWLYRIYDEPKLSSRYLIEYPKFIFYVLFDFVKYKISLKHSSK